MAFINARLLDCVAYGTQGGPTWLTRKITLRSGIVRRNAMRSRPLYRFAVLYRNLKPADHAAVIDAFNACMGGVDAFRLRDWSDYQAEDQLLGVGTGAPQSTQLVKLYTFGANTVSRPIRKPVSASVTLTQNGVSLSGSVDYTTGIATYTAPNASVVRWSGEFDVPVVFADDELLFSSDARGDAGLFLTADVQLEEDLSQ